jgi:hypothetical protein
MSRSDTPARTWGNRATSSVAISSTASVSPESRQHDSLRRLTIPSDAKPGASRGEGFDTRCGGRWCRWDDSAGE